MSQVTYNKKKNVPAKGSVMPPLMIILPLILVFFIGGVYIGACLSEGTESESGTGVSTTGLGLPNTNNVFTKWASDLSPKNLRGALKEIENAVDPRVSHGALYETHPKDAVSASPVAVTKVAESQVVRKETHLQAPLPVDDKAFSLHAVRGAYMSGPKTLDDPNILVTAWIHLDDNSAVDSDMRTVFSNKLPGCETGEGRNGLALYVNGWQQSDHKLYLEYGGSMSGCHKIDSGSHTLQPNRWYHVGVYSGSDSSSLYIDGEEVSFQLFDDNHSTQMNNAFIIGQYNNKEYPFFGNISYVTVSAGVFGKPRDELTALVNRIKDSKHDSLSGLEYMKAIYPLNDAIKEEDMTPAKELINPQQEGVYSFPPPKVGRHNVPGVRIDLIDGIGNRPITEEMRQKSNEKGYERREKIKDGMRHAWSSYKKFAWGRDELKPQSNQGQDNWGGMGVTLVDSLDTLWVMGMKEEFEEAALWVKNQLSFGNAGSVSVFETTIRELGGLLSAYDLSGNTVFLDRAKQLGDLLMPAFNTRTGIPTGMVNFKSGHSSNGWSGSSAILSELGTLQVEFRYLAHHTKSPKYEEKSMKPLQLMRQRRPSSGLFPIKISIDDGSFADSHVTFGALGDSFYEYLLKVWLQGGKKETWLREMYDAAMDGVMDKLLLASDPNGMAFLADWTGTRNIRKMDHLVCFMPGLLALGAYNDPQGLDSQRAQRDLAVAKALMYTCYEMYERQSTGISPEYVEFPPGKDMVVGSTAPFYILRPETAESLFILNQLTGEPVYREWAWNIWEAIDKHCRTNTAYGALANVNYGSKIDDRMESFFLAETVKYLYLAQDPDMPIDLTKYVFNTEAHPTRFLDSSHKPVNE